MITFLTGLPGHGKTLRMVGMIKAALDSGRPVYVHGVKDLKLDVIYLENPFEWQKCPPGSIIFMDEAQNTFPAKAGMERPEFISALNTHRHLGLDIVLVSQHPALIDTRVRKLINEHFHLFRIAGSESSMIYRWSECQDDPRSTSAKSLAETTPWKYPKELYPLYGSAVLHTAKRRIPRPLIALAVLIVIAGLMVYYAPSIFGGIGKQSKGGAAETAQPPQAASGAASAPREVRPMSTEEWLAQFRPRVLSKPWSAPLYDRLMQNASPPRLLCVHVAEPERCTCYTEQATRWVGLKDDDCKRLAREGQYEPLHRMQDSYTTQGPITVPAQKE